MSEFCKGPIWTCPEFGTKSQGKSLRQTTAITHKQNMAFTLTVGPHNIVINSRTRNYSYSDANGYDNTDGKVIINTDGSPIDCFNQTKFEGSGIAEDYSTQDCDILYVDLRNDLVVYQKNNQRMKFSQAQNERIGLKSSFDDIYMYPYVLEDVPISFTTQTICTALGVLHTETLAKGYAEGIRILMPLFGPGANPLPFKFTMNGVEYDASEVDWYLINEGRRISDGNQYFWWADWHKAVGTNLEIDAAETARLSNNVLYGITSQVAQSGNGIITKNFMGSAAIDKDDNRFYSMAITPAIGVPVKINKLVVGGAEIEIPKEKIKVEQPDGSFAEQDSEHTCYFPIAPL